MVQNTAVKARIAGRVQGVSYRAWTQETALTYGLTGWVRNCDTCRDCGDQRLSSHELRELKMPQPFSAVHTT